MMLMALEVLTLGALAFYLALALRAIARERASLVHACLCLFLLFYGMPLLLDLLIGSPDYGPIYDEYRFLRRYAVVPVARVVYCLYLILVPLTWLGVSWLRDSWTTAGRSGLAQPVEPASTAPEVASLEPASVEPASLPLTAPAETWIGMGALLLIAAAPLVAVLFAPTPSLYFQGFGAIFEGVRAPEVMAWHSVVERAAILAIVAVPLVALGCGMTARRWLPWAMPLMLLCGWLQGKRLGFLLALMGFVAVLLLRQWLPRRILWIAALVLTAAFAGFALSKVGSRGWDAGSVAEAQGYVRLYLSREHGMKVAINDQLGLVEHPLVEPPGGSLAFLRWQLTPKPWRGPRPLPYSAHLQAIAAGVSPAAYARENSRGALLTSWLGEAVASFGVLGYLIGPATLLLICLVGDATGRDDARWLSFVILFFLFFVHSGAFVLVKLLWCALVAWYGVQAARRWWRGRGDSAMDFRIAG